MKFGVYLILAFTILLISISCNKGKKVVIYVNSYHLGYKPSDEILNGIQENLPSDEYELIVYYLDSKLQKSSEILSLRLDTVRNLIYRLKPSVIAASDDYAVKYLIEPFYNKSDIPVVYCGINWSSEQYNLNHSHITGMVEVLPLKESINLIKKYIPGVKSISIISENTLSERNNTLLLDTLYRNSGLIPTYYLVDDYDEWKESFTTANELSDLIYLPTNGAISRWNDEQAVAFVGESIKKPVFTCDDFMMNLCVFGLTKVPKEQGIWVAETVKKIITGVSPSQIPETRNHQTTLFLNTKLAAKIGFIPDSALIRNSETNIINAKN